MQEEVLSNLRACISSRKGGVSIRELNSDYRELVGENVPFSKLGFQSLEEFLSTVPAVAVDGRTGTVTAVPTAKNRHLLELISKQKDKVKRRSNVFKPYKRQYTHSRAYEPPRHNYRSSGYVQPPYHQKQRPFNYTNHSSKYTNHSSNYTNYNHAPSHFNHAPSHFNHAPSHFNHAPSHFNHAPSHFNHTPSHFNHAPSHFNHAPSHFNHAPPRFTGNHDYGQLQWIFPSNGKNRQHYSQNYEPYQHSKYNTQQCKRPTDPNNNSTHTDLRHRIHARKNKNSKPAFIYDHQVIGDDLMLETLGLEPRTLCDSGMTAKRALLGVREYGCIDQVVIAIGSIDILMGAGGDELILNMQQLIQTVQCTGASVYVCTIPPIPSISGHRAAIDAIITFNNWVRFGNHGAQIIELHSLFKDGPFVNYGMFTVLPKYTHGCMWPLRPWNIFAQAAVLDQLEWDLSTNW